jgi:hypothetical protein
MPEPTNAEYVAELRERISLLYKEAREKEAVRSLADAAYWGGYSDALVEVLGWLHNGSSEAAS